MRFHCSNVPIRFSFHFQLCVYVCNKTQLNETQLVVILPFLTYIIHLFPNLFVILFHMLCSAVSTYDRMDSITFYSIHINSNHKLDKLYKFVCRQVGI